MDAHLKINITKECLDACNLSYDKHTLVLGEVETLVIDEPEHTIIAFRGTEASKMWSGGGWRDVLRDIRTIPWRDKRVGWSHAGFLKGARRIVEHLYTDYGLSKSKPLLVTGHSLGGALAVNAAALLHSYGYEVKGVITFGSPRTFKRRTADKWREKLGVLNYSNDGDPVCDVPVSWFGWRHVNEVSTQHISKSYGWDNHMLPAYNGAFNLNIQNGQG